MNSIDNMINEYTNGTETVEQILQQMYRLKILNQTGQPLKNSKRDCERQYNYKRNRRSKSNSRRKKKIYDKSRRYLQK